MGAIARKSCQSSDCQATQNSHFLIGHSSKGQAEQPKLSPQANRPKQLVCDTAATCLQGNPLTFFHSTVSFKASLLSCKAAAAIPFASNGARVGLHLE